MDKKNRYGPFVVFNELIPHEISYCGIKTKGCKLITILIIRIQAWKNGFFWDFFAFFVGLNLRAGKCWHSIHINAKEDNEQYQVIRTETAGDIEECGRIFDFY